MQATDIHYIGHKQMANCILLAQLIATLMRYPCTVVLMGLVDWSAFPELVLLTM